MSGAALRAACCSPDLELRATCVGQWVQADDALAGRHPFERERLLFLLYDGIPCHLLGQSRRHHHGSFVVADDEVARHDEDARAGDGDVGVEREVESRA